MQEYSIQDLCDRTSLPRRTIHFYVQQGILPPPEGAGVGTRYTETHLLCLKLIPLLRRKGLKLDDIRTRLRGLDEKDLSVLHQQVFEAHPPALLPAGQPYTHYALPAGLSLIAPATLTPKERKKLNELLKAANEIFAPLEVP